MSHRTEDLEQLSGAAHVVRELRYSEVARQTLAIVLILVYAFTSNPNVATAIIGLTAGLIGMLIRLYASGYIIKNKQLATTGPYAFVRHPLYTGNVLLVMGFALANSSLWAIPLAIGFFWFYYPPAIEYEDRKLRKIFGHEWENWAGSTPALVPRLAKGVHRGGFDNWSFATSMRKNGELLIVLFVVACAYRIVSVWT